MSAPRLYVFGNGNLGFDTFLARYVPGLERALACDAAFLVCDFRGADTLTLEWLKDRTAAVTLLHVGERPRYRPDAWRTRVSEWTMQGGFASDAARDAAAIAACTAFLALDQNSDARRTSGTARIIEACLAAGRRAWGADPQP